MIAILFSVGLRWVLIGLALVVLWYILAPLFTPKPLKGKRGRPEQKETVDDTDVIEGKGRIIE